MTAAATQDLFDKAVQIAEGLSKEGPIQVNYTERLLLYALFKQATLGDVSGSRPGILDQLGRAKYDAHKKRSGMAVEQAQKAYADTLVKILKKFSDRTIAVEYIRELEKTYRPAANLQNNLAASELSSSSSYDSESDSAESNHAPIPGPSSRPHRTPSGSIILPPSRTGGGRSIASSSKLNSATLKAHQKSLERLAVPPPLPIPSPSQFELITRQRPPSSANLPPTLEPWLQAQPLPTPLPPQQAPNDSDSVALRKTLESIQLSLNGLHDRLHRLEKRKNRNHWVLQFWKSYLGWDKIRDWAFLLAFVLLGWRAAGVNGWAGMLLALVRRRIGGGQIPVPS